MILPTRKGSIGQGAAPCVGHRGIRDGVSETLKSESCKKKGSLSESPRVLSWRRTNSQLGRIFTMANLLGERGAARSASDGASSSSRAPSQEVPTERAAPWCMSLEEIDNSPSRAYFAKKYGAEKAKSREQECRLATCAFLQESGHRLRL